MPNSLLLPDVGVLLGSQSNQVFMDMVDLYPGARKLFDAVQSIPCNCGDPSCPRLSFQLVLQQASHNVNEHAARFIQEAEEKQLSNCEQVRELMYDYYHRNLPPEEKDPRVSFITLDGFDGYGGGPFSRR